MHLRFLIDFAYDDSLPNGPSHWSEVCPDAPACSNGKRQSPIDIATSLADATEIKALNATYVEVDSMIFENMYVYPGMQL